MVDLVVQEVKNKKMFYIKIEESDNKGRSEAGKYFVKYNPTTNKAEFTDNISAAGIFVLDMNHKNAYWGNLMALYDRLGLNGMIIPIDK